VIRVFEELGVEHADGDRECRRGSRRVPHVSGMKPGEQRETTEGPHDDPCHGPVHLDQLPGTLQAPQRTALLPSMISGRASPVPDATGALHDVTPMGKPSIGARIALSIRPRSPRSPHSTVAPELTIAFSGIRREGAPATLARSRLRRGRSSLQFVLSGTQDCERPEEDSSFVAGSRPRSPTCRWLFWNDGSAAMSDGRVPREGN
jgi:hypothetical protein